ncbi:lasso peptide biosynthesis B2 protein [Paenibacillus rhizovicinus]|uniref:Lasso peptide biosynthesis B2 protein n=1 Tax=Paenibacillus rhizovicinus TaxID=2704463 RepID=A0A6C0NXI5_9BACL|nr:lasso peptide biosynthesis B2 protein [Paenibacillus rhizovicinus]QHW30851.1 lasso peptide biosynthesis B2 protein [Paenibacillus rhizovicinus]
MAGLAIRKSLRRFWSWDQETRLLLIESVLYLGWARILKSLPFRWVSPSLGRWMAETTYGEDDADLACITQISRMLHLASRYTWWESACMVRAIAAMKMLERRKIGSTLYLGAAKDESGTMIAHAWLRSGSFMVTGGEEREGFAVVAIFGKWIQFVSQMPRERR